MKEILANEESSKILIGNKTDVTTEVFSMTIVRLSKMTKLFLVKMQLCSLKRKIIKYY